MFGGRFCSYGIRFGIGFWALGIVWGSFLELQESFWCDFLSPWDHFGPFWFQVVFKKPLCQWLYRHLDHFGRILEPFGSHLGAQKWEKEVQNRYQKSIEFSCRFSLIFGWFRSSNIMVLQWIPRAELGFWSDSFLIEILIEQVWFFDLKMVQNRSFGVINRLQKSIRILGRKKEGPKSKKEGPKSKFRSLAIDILDPRVLGNGHIKRPDNPNQSPIISQRLWAKARRIVRSCRMAIENPYR